MIISRDKKMLYQAKKVIKNLKSNDINGIVSELINNYHYFSEPIYFYQVFGLQGGTVWQLTGYILNEKKGGVKNG